jgi:hypothetical protein
MRYIRSASRILVYFAIALWTGVFVLVFFHG